MLRSLRRGFHMPSHRKLVLIEALACTLAAWVTIRLMPYAAWRSNLGRPAPVAPGQVNGTPARNSGSVVLEDIAWAHALLARWFDGRFTCLMLALSAKALLRRRQLPSLLVLGATRSKKGEAKELCAHAWVLSAGFEIVGGDTREGHSVVAAYYG